MPETVPVPLGQETGFARDTVRKALALLINEDRLYVVRGLGTFVRATSERQS
jgi:DNA-binding GntR family transcriptional regulator